MNPLSAMVFGVALLLLGPLCRSGQARSRRIRPAVLQGADKPDRRRVLLPTGCGAITGLSIIEFDPGRLYLGPVLGLAAGLITHRVRSRAAAGTPIVDPKALALGLELIAAALTGGQPPDGAIAAVAASAESMPQSGVGTALKPLDQVGRMIRWGAEPAQAWALLAERRGYETVAVAGSRCTESGARLAEAFRASAAELRAREHADALTRASRVGIWSLLPLGLCFLPAFVCIGIVPVVGGLARQLLTGALH